MNLHIHMYIYIYIYMNMYVYTFTFTYTSTKSRAPIREANDSKKRWFFSSNVGSVVIVYIELNRELIFENFHKH